MNKTSMIRNIDEPPLRIMAIGSAYVYEFWQQFQLSAPIWRLYIQKSSGCGVMLPSGECMKLKKNMLYLITPNSDLITWCDNKECYQLFIHFSLPRRPAPNCRGNGIFELACEDSFVSMVEELENYLDDGRNDMFQAILAAQALCAAAILRLPGKVFSFGGRDVMAEKLAAYLEKHLNNAPTLEEMAAGCKLSVSSMQRRFRAAFGSSVYGYLTAMRYHAAAEMLRGSEYTVEQICEMTGINDRFHFSRMFKKFYGCPPARYRKLYLAASSRKIST